MSLPPGHGSSAPADRRSAGRALQSAIGEALSSAGRPLPRVLHDVPAAVLLVDIDSGAVVHVNPAARALAGAALTLPVPGEVWSRAAGVRQSDGTPFGPGLSPVERAAAGEPVLGNPVLVGTGARWATAFPLPGTPEQALVVLFELSVPADPDVLVRDRAVVAAGLSFTISDPRQPDAPLVYVNPAFERTTGYSAQESVGRNCRFLQGPSTDPADVDRLRRALADEEPTVLTLLNYRKDGTAFWNELSLSPVHDGTGTLTHFVGIQADVTARVLAEQQRAQHLESEQTARADAERAQRRLALLAEATSMLAATLDVDEALRRLTDLVVPVLADFCTVDVVGPNGGLRRISSKHRNPQEQPLLSVVEELQAGALTGGSATAKVLAGGAPALLEHLPDDYFDDKVASDELVAAFRALDIRSAMVVPLRARRQVLGALGLFTNSSRAGFTTDDLTAAADLGRRAGLAIDNARLYQHQHDVAEALQRSLLPRLPEVEGLVAAARYLPSGTSGAVGGDWYDLLQLPDGAVGVAVGDVMGHDITAAAAMGQFRSVLRSYAWQGGSPAQVLDHLDQLVQGLGITQLATALYARLSLPAAGRPGRLHYANAGHLPPALRRPDGSVQLLRDAQSLLVGAALGTERTEAVVELPAGSVLVLYTDGLVEDRDRDIDDGLDLLRRSLERAPEDPEGICDALTRDLSTTQRADDVAVLAVRVL